MDPNHLFLFIFLSFFLVTVLQLPPSHCQLEDDNYFVNCSRPYECGNIKNIPYPFWGGPRPEFCGHRGHGYELKCRDNPEFPLLEFEELQFRVLNIDQSNRTMTIARMDLWDHLCPPKFFNTTFNFSLLDYAPNVRNLTLYYGCHPDQVNMSVPNTFTCNLTDSGDATTAFYVDDSVQRISPSPSPSPSLSLPNRTECKFGIRVPIFKNLLTELHEGGAGELQEALNKGFDVKYNSLTSNVCSKCEESGGKCGSDSASQFLCFCPNQVQHFGCSSGRGKPSVTSKIIIGPAVSVIGLILLTLIIIFCFKSNKSTNIPRKFWMKITKNEDDLEAFIRNYGSLALKRYHFSDIKKMTNSFTDKLGQGGYGGVYKGKLLDGSPVAVKLLNTSKGNGEEFINEVASIRKTSHVNIVTLLGFCFEGSKRALIYEFMPNGSLEKFIYNDKPEKTTPHIGWEKLFQIATGTARGLEYLHRGCNTRILHFDIKPHNILLDKDFVPKISDFGLAKLCPRKESIISMMDARGTIGYIAPEVFSRNFGGVSHKSDVYSYGMMVLEMVGGRKNTDVGTSDTSETYFPHWIYKHLELGNDLGFPGNLSREENEMARKMTLVGLWCIQTNPSDRPSMTKVIEMLEGSIEALQIPPKPFLSSPPRLPAESSTTSMMVDL